MPGFGSDFMEFSHGWNETVTGGYHELVGGAEYLFNKGENGDGQSQMASLEGGVEAMEGHEMVNEGETRMGSGIANMAGDVADGAKWLWNKL